MPHSTTEMRPDELFFHRQLRTRLTLMQPNLTPTVQKHQQQQKQSHDKKTPLVIFANNESVLVRNTRGKECWLLGKIVRQKSPVTYLVQIGNQIRFCHVDHLLKTGIKPTSLGKEEDIMEVPSFNGRDERGESPEVSSQSNTIQGETCHNDTPMVIHSPATNIPRHSSHIRQPTKCLVKEI